MGEDWIDSEDESECGDYGTEVLPTEIVNKAERKLSQTVRIVPDQRKSSTGSNVKKPVKIYLNEISLKVFFCFRPLQILWTQQRISNLWTLTLNL